MPPQDRREDSGNEIAIAIRPYLAAYRGNNEKRNLRRFVGGAGVGAQPWP